MPYTVVLVKGRRSVQLVLDNMKSKFNVTPSDGPEESRDFGGDWPYCYFEFLAKVKALRDQGFRPKIAKPSCRVIDSFRKYRELIVDEQKYASKHSSSAGMYAATKKKYGFKTKKEYDDERTAWYAYLLHEPELMAKVDSAQAAAMD